MGVESSVAINLCSLWPSMRRDTAGSLKVLADAGYDGVELVSLFGGFYGLTAQEFKGLLDEAGLACPSWHAALAELSDDVMGKTIETARLLGVRHVIVAERLLPEGADDDPQAWMGAVARLNAISSRLAPAGLALGVHNHTYEFTKAGESFGWGILFDNADPAVTQQLDTAHCVQAGVDPAAMILRYAKRSRTVHLKEEGPEGIPFGQGLCPWDSILDACTKAGTEWYITERWMGYDLPDDADLRGARQYRSFLRDKGLD